MAYKYGELRKYIDENKNYKIEFFSKLISDIIMLAGVSFMLKSTDNWNNESFTYFLIWYLLQTVLFELVKSIEFEIKSDGLINMISSRTSIVMIYFRRSIVWLVKAAILFSIVIFLSGNGLNGIIQFKPNLILAIILALILMYGVFFLFMALTFIYERVASFTGFITTAFLIFGYKLTITQEIRKIIVGNQADMKKIVLNLILLYAVSYHFMKKARTKLQYRGF